MDWRDTPEQAAWREEVRGFVQTELPDEFKQNALGAQAYFPSPDSPLAGALDRWRKSLAGQGWIAPHWPKEYGGAGLGTIDQFIMTQEFAEARAPEGGRFARPAAAALRLPALHRGSA